jgi:hypothetical protein
VEPPRTAHEPIATLVEAKQPVGLQGQTDPYTSSDWPGRLRHRAQSERPICAQISAVASVIDPHRRGKPAGTTSEIENP